MIRTITVFAFSFLLQSAEQPHYKVKVAGEMRRIMQAGELTSVIKLDTIKNKQHLFGLGPAALLKGEIITIDGVSFLSEIVGEKIVNTKRANAEAAMFVYADIEKWETRLLSEDVNDMQSLERLIVRIAEEKGLDMKQP